MSKVVRTVPHFGKCSGAPVVILEDEESLASSKVTNGIVEAEVVCLSCGQRVGYAIDIPDQVAFVLAILVRNCFTWDSTIESAGPATKFNLTNSQDSALKAALAYNAVDSAQWVEMSDWREAILSDEQKEALPPLARQVLNRICEHRIRVFCQLVGTNQLVISYLFRSRQRVGAQVQLQSKRVEVQLKWQPPAAPAP